MTSRLRGSSSTVGMSAELWKVGLCQRSLKVKLAVSHIWLYLGAMDRTWEDAICSQSLQARPWLSLEVS